MKRIALIGLPGAGKTYLANRVSEELGLGMVDIDNLFNLFPHTFRSKQSYVSEFKELFPKDNWIIGGYHPDRHLDYIWAKADTIIFLDFPYKDLLKITFDRFVTARKNKDGAYGQDSLGGLFRVSRLILFYRNKIGRVAKRVESSLDDNQDYIVLRSRDEVDEFLAKL